MTAKKTETPTQDISRIGGKYLVITGWQNAGKTHYLQKQAQIAGDRGKSYLLIDSCEPLTDSLNRALQTVHQFKTALAEATQTQNLSLNQKWEVLIRHLGQQPSLVLIDNLDKFTPRSRKAEIAKQLIIVASQVMVTTMDEAHIPISLRDILMQDRQQYQLLKLKGKFRPTFDVTHVVYALLILTAVLTGHHNAALVLGGLALASNHSFFKAKQR